MTIDLLELRDVLEEQRLDLKKLLVEQAQKNKIPAVGDSDGSALAQRYESQQRRSNAVARAERVLKKINAALLRLDNGTFGICISCNQQIQAGRLQALPYTTLCIRCKQAQESRFLTL